MANIERTAFDEAYQAVRRKSQARRKETGKGLSVEEAMREFYKAGVEDGAQTRHAGPLSNYRKTMLALSLQRDQELARIQAAFESGEVKVSPIDTPFNSRPTTLSPLSGLSRMTPDDCRLGGKYGN